MRIFIHVDTPDMDAVAEPLVTAIGNWIAGCNCTAQVVDDAAASGERVVGLRIDTGKRAVLKTALDALHGLAQAHAIDFVVGYLDDAGTAHKVCFFGNEEGRPDIAEIGSYLGLRR